MNFWTRPLHAMTDAFTAAGFRIAVISEPAPAPAARGFFVGSTSHSREPAAIVKDALTISAQRSLGRFDGPVKGLGFH